jgi:hypothetical protein
LLASRTTDFVFTSNKGTRLEPFGDDAAVPSLK